MNHSNSLFISIVICGEQFYSECTREDFDAFRRVLSANKQVSWSVRLTGEEEYKGGIYDAEHRTNRNIERISKKSVWQKIFG